MSVLISCEVGGARVPVQWPALRVSGRDGSVKRRGRSQSVGRVSGGSKQSVQKESEIVADTTAMYVAERMAKCLGAPLIANEYSNQVIDVRRSLRHRQLFSKPMRGLPAEDRQRLIDTIHTPYRDRLRTSLQRMLSRSPYVIHLSVESFPLKSSSGKAKKLSRADMGLSYDPADEHEVNLALDWIDEMYEVLPMLRVTSRLPRSAAPVTASRKQCARSSRGRITWGWS